MAHDGDVPPKEYRPPKRPAFANPDILRWARESTLLDLETAAKMAGVTDAGKLARAEQGTGFITFRQLERLAHKCGLPLRIFYLKQRPEEERLPVDFRSAADERGQTTTALIKLLRSARARQHAAIDLFSELGWEDKSLPQASSDAEIIHILTPLVCAKRWDRERLRGSVDSRGLWALAHTKEIIEDRLPVLVFEYPGDVSHVRGCSLYDERLSVVLVSSEDTPNARRFTIVHELVHLLMRESGICAPLSPHISDQIERRCNVLAGEALMPSDGVRAQIQDIEKVGIDRKIDQLAIMYRVSHSAAAVRLRQLDVIKADELKLLLDRYRTQWNEARKKLREREAVQAFTSYRPNA